MYKVSNSSFAWRKFNFMLQPCIYSIPLNGETSIKLKSTCKARHQSQYAAKRPLYHHSLLNASSLYICKKHFSRSPQLYIQSSFQEDKRKRILTSLYYTAAIAFITLGVSYAAVPLYRIFCSASGYGGTVKIQDEGAIIEKLDVIKERVLRIIFMADTAATMQWNFVPAQRSVTVNPGETVLAFYKAKNPTDKQVIGVSTYNVLPFTAGPYFNKIQCFCFEEQMLNPQEEVDMPVFFYIDPEFDDDPAMEDVHEIILSYTFFEVKHGMKNILPSKRS